MLEVTKKKTDIKGFWKDETGKVHIDNIKLFYPQNAGEFESKLFIMFSEGEKAVFTYGKNKAFIINKNGDTITLNQKISERVDKLSFNQIKNWLNEYGGVTVFKSPMGYLLESWKE
jgi:hypothetical protein